MVQVLKLRKGSAYAETQVSGPGAQDHVKQLTHQVKTPGSALYDGEMTCATQPAYQRPLEQGDLMILSEPLEGFAERCLGLVNTFGELVEKVKQGHESAEKAVSTAGLCARGIVFLSDSVPLVSHIAKLLGGGLSCLADFLKTAGDAIKTESARKWANERTFSSKNLGHFSL
jgi:hypothetical protein